MPLFSLNFDYDIANLCESSLFSLFIWVQTRSRWMCKLSNYPCNKKAELLFDESNNKRKKLYEKLSSWHDCFILFFCSGLSPYKRERQHCVNIPPGLCHEDNDNDNKKCLFSLKCIWQIFFPLYVYIPFWFSSFSYCMEINFMFSFSFFLLLRTTIGFFGFKNKTNSSFVHKH